MKIINARIDEYKQDCVLVQEFYENGQVGFRVLSYEELPKYYAKVLSYFIK